MKRLNREDNEKRRYRLKELNRRLDAMRDEVVGRTLGFADRILDADGSLDEEKVQSLIDDMLDSLQGYLALTGREVLSEDEERAYRAYLYLALTGPGEESVEYLCGFEFVPARNFGSLTGMTDDDFLLAGSEERLDGLLENYMGEFGDFLDGLVYSLIYRAHRFCEVLREPYPRFEGGYREGFFSEDSHTDFVQWQNYVDRVYPAWERFAKRLPEADRFARAFAEYKQLIFRIDRDRFATDIADMVDIYLYEAGLSPLAFGDAYGLIDHGMKRKLRQLHRETERARVLDENRQ